MSNNKDTLALHAHTMRQAPTDSEARLWRALRSSQLGVAFRRQVPLLGFIADFYAPSARLIVEVDCGYHARRVTADARRDRKLERAGYRVVRLQAELVMRDLLAAVRAVRRGLDEP
ncbi:MAG: endonuclease domain-containing protein [Pseudomonadota bacterium]